MGAAAYWARAALRRSRGGILLVLLVALGVGGAMAAAAGSRRTATADERLDAVSNPPSAFVGASDLPTLEAIVGRPEVAAASAFEQFGVQPATEPCGDASEHYFPFFVPIAGEAFAVPRPRLVHGRFADPDAPDEAVVSEQHAARLGVGVGDRIQLLPFLIDPDAGEITGCGEDPVAEVVVVGVIREYLELGAAGEPTLAATYLTPAFAEAHGEESVSPLFGFGGFVHLRDDADISAFIDDVGESLGAGVDGEGFGGAFAFGGPSPLEPTLDALAVGLWGLAAALALATVAVTVAAAVRQTAAAAPELRLLAAVGLGRRELQVASALPVAVPLAIGVLLAPAVATLLSTVHLVGLARRVEPDPGIDVDPVVLLAGTAAALLVLGAATAFLAWRGASRALRADDQGGGGRVSLADRFARLGAPPWASLGVGYAFEGRRGRQGRRAALPGRAAVLGVAAGTAGVVGVLVFGTGVGRANDDPAVYGWGDWHASASAATEEAQAGDELEELLLAEDDLTAISNVQGRFQLELDGTRYGGSPVEHIRGAAGPTVVSGRLPVGTAEIALGSDTAERLGAGVGSSVRASGPDGEADLRVVGLVALLGFDGDSVRSGWTTDRAAVDALGWGPGCNDEQECFTTTAIAFRDGADIDEIIERLAAADVDVELPEPSAEVVLLAEADQIPGMAAAGVAVVAAAGLLHAVAVTVSRRRHELSIVRAIGFDRRQSAGVLVAEALAAGVAGALLGGLVGATAGRLAWQAAARAIGIGPQLPGIAPLTAAVVVGVVVLALLTGLWPAVRAARLPAAAGLQEER